MVPAKFHLHDLVRAALLEDIGGGDLTTSLTVPPAHRSEARMVAREQLVVTAMDVAEQAFAALDPAIRFDAKGGEGSIAQAGDVIAVVVGNTRAILSGERVALNFLQRLCGTATLTRRFVDQVSDLDVRVVDTRKTTPGLRVLEKRAVRSGGGFNHRFGLYDGVLIKDNHLAAAGGERAIEGTIAHAKERAPHLIKVEIEVGTPREAEGAARAGADAVLLDNMLIADMREAVVLIRSVDPHVIVEASGCVSLDNIREVAETGVDIISAGALTHSAPAVDISLVITEGEQSCDQA